MRLVIIESPYAGDVETNVAYARACMLDSLRRGEAPIASHLLYTQVLDDNDPEERAMGIAAGLAWRKAVVRVPEVVTVGDASKGEREVPIVRATAGTTPVLPAFYTDLGWSQGMLAAFHLYKNEGVRHEERQLGVAMKYQTWRSQTENAYDRIVAMRGHIAKLDAVDVTHPEPERNAERRQQLEEQIAAELELAAIAIAVVQSKWGMREREPVSDERIARAVNRMVENGKQSLAEARAKRGV